MARARCLDNPMRDLVPRLASSPQTGRHATRRIDPDAGRSACETGRRERARARAETHRSPPKICAVRGALHGASVAKPHLAPDPVGPPVLTAAARQAQSNMRGATYRAPDASAEGGGQDAPPPKSRLPEEVLGGGARPPGEFDSLPAPGAEAPANGAPQMRFAISRRQ